MGEKQAFDDQRTKCLVFPFLKSSIFLPYQVPKTNNLNFFFPMISIILILGQIVPQINSELSHYSAVHGTNITFSSKTERFVFGLCEI